MRTAVVAVLAAVTMLGHAVPAAQAHDSRAPRGAPHSWLPEQDWVMQHWLPFDEADLYRVLGVDNLMLERWLRDDHRTIAQLARKRTGIAPKQLALHLVALRGTLPRARVRVLRQRALRVVTQGHLAQHIFFHYFHGTGALGRTRQVFGVGRRTFTRLRMRGSTPLAIGRYGGRTRERVVRGMRRLLRRMARAGVRRRAHSPRQGRLMLQRRRALLHCFLRRPVPKLDPANPYGDPHNGHGRHRRADRRGIKRGSKQRRARRHPRCCWDEPRLPLGP